MMREFRRGVAVVLFFALALMPSPSYGKHKGLTEAVESELWASMIIMDEQLVFFDQLVQGLRKKIKNSEDSLGEKIISPSELKENYKQSA